jgi:hypothetical protein
MATAIQRRRGNTAQHASFTGLAGEITIDTDKNTVVVHDGVTAGGYPLAKSSEIQALGSGDITAVIAGDGLSGGSTSGNATINIGAGSGITVNADNIALTSGIVTPGTYGSATQVAQITVDTFGRTTGASNVTVTPAVGSITGLGTGVATFLATPSSANLLAAVTDETGTGALVFANTPTLVTPNIGAATGTSLTTTGAAGVLARAAANQDGVEIRGRAGGSGNWEVVITPTTLSADRTVTLADGNTVLAAGTMAVIGGTLGQFAATTSSQLAGVISDETGSGALVFANTPTLVTPTLGVATATSINKVAFTAPATGSTLTIAEGKTLTASNTLTFTGTDASSVAFGAGGTVTYTTSKLSAFAATTSSELAGVISDETGSGALVFATSPTLVTPTLGAANATSLSTTGNISVGANLTVTGNLIVNGVTTTVNSTTVTIDDPIFTLGGDTAPGSDDNKDRGIEFRWHNGTTAKLGFFGFDDSTGQFTFIPDATNTSDVFSGTTGILDVASITGSAARWTTARTITLGGDLSGSVSLDGSANATLTATIAADSVALGTDTTGNYVASMTSGNGITVGTATGEGSTPVITNTGVLSINTLTGNVTGIATTGNLSQFAATTSAQLAGVISDETGTGALVFANTPTLVTPTLGVATATSINKVAFTAPATSATLTIANGKTLTASNTLTFTGTDASSVAFGAGGTVAYTANKLSVFAATTSAELAGVISDETGSGALVFANTPTLVTPNIGAATGTSLTTTGASGVLARVATNQDGVEIRGRAGGTGNWEVVITPTTLTADRTVTLADGNTTLQAGTMAVIGGTLGQFAATTSSQLAGVISDETGSGALVFATSPTLTTPTLGVATATSINKVAFTAPATGSTLTIADGKTLTASNTLTFTGTDSSSVAFGAGGTVLYSGGALGTPSSGTLTNATGLPVSSGISGLGTGVATALAANVGSAGAFVTFNGALGTPSSGTLTNATGLPVSSGISGLGTGVATFLATPSSANLLAAVTDETGTGALVFATSPTLTTPTLGVATATSINKVAFTAPATSATLTIANGKTLTVNNTLTFTGTDSSSVAFGAGGTVAYTANKLSVFAATTSAELAGVISDETGSGALVFGTSPTFTTDITTPAILKSGTNGTGDIGQTANRYGTVWANTFSGVSTTARYADLAEKYSADAEYEPGTVLHFGGEAEVTLCDTDMCRKVAGVVTTAPAHLMNSELEGVTAAIALQGRVPCKVVGPVAKGDMMVSAGNGYARAEENPVLGAVIGKSLENFDGAEGVIEVAVGRL